MISESTRCVCVCVCVCRGGGVNQPEFSVNGIFSHRDCRKQSLSNLASNPFFGWGVGTKFRPLFSSDFSVDVRRLVLPVRLTMLVRNPKSGWTLPFPGLSLS